MLSNNKFQTENINLKADLKEAQFSLKESLLKNMLLRKALSDTQTELAQLQTLQEQIDTMIFERTELNEKLKDANNYKILLEAQLDAKNKELAMPREVVIQAPIQVDIYERKYNELSLQYSELVRIYNVRARQLDDLDAKVDAKDKVIRELNHSLELINKAVEKFKNENVRLRKNLPIIEPVPPPKPKKMIPVKHK